MAKVTDPAKALEQALKGKALSDDWCIKKEQFKEKDHATRWKKGLTANGFTCDMAKDFTVTGVRIQCPKCQTKIDAYSEPCCNLNCV